MPRLEQPTPVKPLNNMGARVAFTGVVAPHGTIKTTDLVLATLGTAVKPGGEAAVKSLVAGAGARFSEAVAGGLQNQDTFFNQFVGSLRQYLLNELHLLDKIQYVIQIVREDLAVGGIKLNLAAGGRGLPSHSVLVVPSAGLSDSVIRVVRSISKELKGSGFVVVALKPKGRDLTASQMDTMKKLDVLDVKAVSGIEDIRHQLGAAATGTAAPLFITVAGDEESYRLVEEGVKLAKDQSINITQGIVDAPYWTELSQKEPGAVAYFAALALRSTAASSGKELVFVYNDSGMSDGAREFMRKYSGLFYPIKRIWQYLIQMYKSVIQTAASA